MIYKIFLVFALVISISGFAQNTSEENEMFVINDDTKEISFAVIENVPVYKNCDEKLSNNELKECMSQSISKHILENFNVNVCKGLGLPNGIIRILVNFKVNVEGEVSDIEVRAPHPDLEKEAIKVISSIPKFAKPGFHKGKPATVSYALPIVFRN